MSELHPSSPVDVRPSPQMLAEPREQTQRLDHFSQTLFRHLDGFGVRYCALDLREETEDTPSIVQELAVHPEDRGKLLATLRSLEDKDYFVVQERISVIRGARDRKSTRLNSSHLGISYAVFCLKKKKKKK